MLCRSNAGMELPNTYVDNRPEIRHWSWTIEDPSTLTLNMSLFWTSTTYERATIDHIASIWGIVLALHVESSITVSAHVSAGVICIIRRNCSEIYIRFREEIMWKVMTFSGRNVICNVTRTNCGSEAKCQRTECKYPTALYTKKNKPRV
jgi:hypothetical protein